MQKATKHAALMGTQFTKHVICLLNRHQIANRGTRAVILHGAYLFDETTDYQHWNTLDCLDLVLNDWNKTGSVRGASDSLYDSMEDYFDRIIWKKPADWAQDYWRAQEANAFEQFWLPHMHIDWDAIFNKMSNNPDFNLHIGPYKTIFKLGEKEPNRKQHPHRFKPCSPG